MYFTERRVLLGNCFLIFSCFAYSSTLQMVAICFSELSVDFQRIIRHCIAEDTTIESSFLFESSPYLDCAILRCGIVADTGISKEYGSSIMLTSSEVHPVRVSKDYNSASNRLSASITSKLVNLDVFIRSYHEYFGSQMQLFSIFCYIVRIPC
jgi:hypothetical protein